MGIALLTLITALAISAVAAFYSIVGLMAIFSASAISIAVMGVVLEIGKLITASWLYQNWYKIPRLLKYYLTLAVVVLMFITSMGIFGYLSKAHIDQGTGTQELYLKVERIENSIGSERKIIERAEKQITLLDKALEVYIDKEYVSRGLKERKKQEEERTLLNNAINEASDKIAELTNQKAELSLAQDKIEAEVGPIKYVAELIYGEKAQDNFDKSVRFVILILIFVFDPLAVLLLIAANISLRQWRKKRNLIKSEEKFNLEERLERERNKLKKVREKTRDYRKMMTKIGDFKDMSPDEIKVKLDQIYDWNDKSIK